MNNKLRKSIIEDFKKVASEHPRSNFTRALYLKHGKHSKGDWEDKLDCCFTDLKHEAGLVDTGFKKDLTKARRDGVKASIEKKHLRETIKKQNYKHIKKIPSKDVFTAVISSDWHGIYTDLSMRDLKLEICRDMQPDYIIWNGDLFNFGGLSRHDERWEDEDLVKELEFIEKEVWIPFSEASPKSRKYLVFGNHDANPFRHIMRTSNTFLRLLDYANISQADLLGLKKYKVEAISKFDFVPRGKRKQEGVIRKNSLELHNLLSISHYPPHKGKCPGMHSVHGHTHKPLKWTTANKKGKYDHIVMGCMCYPDSEYFDGDDTCVNGFCIAYMFPKQKSAYLDAITVTGDTVMVGGKPYERKKQ